MGIGIADDHCDDRTHVSIAQGQRRASGAQDSGPAARPLVAKYAHAIGIGDAQRVHGEHLVFCGKARDDRHTNRRVIDIDHRQCCSAGQSLQHAMGIGIADNRRDHRAHVSIAQGQRRGCGAQDIHPTACPLVAKYSHAIGIGDAGRAYRQRLVFSSNAGDDRQTHRHIVDVGDRPGN